MKSAEFTIPAVRGMQSGHACYSAMCPIRLLPRLFPVGVDRSTGSNHQSFGKVNRTRVRDIARAIVDSRDSYHIASITVSIEQRVRFVPVTKFRTTLPVAGELFIPLDAKLAILDGLHRVFGLQRALAECPSLADDSVAMLIHVDPDGKRRGQLFSDLKRHEHSAAQSLRIGFDERDELARLTRDLIEQVPVFTNSIELEKTAISNRSRKLFTLSALYQANRTLLADQNSTTYEARLKLAVDFWTEVANRIPGWNDVINGSVSAAEIRAGYVHCHAIGIAALARSGRALLAQFPTTWRRRLARLSSLDWSRSNTDLWEGRAMIGGRLSKSSTAVARAGDVVKKHLGLDVPN